MTNSALTSLRIVFLGTAPFAVPSLRMLAAGEAHLVAVFTPPDRPAGRGRSLRPPAVKVAALELGLPVFQPERVSREDGMSLLRPLAPDLMILTAFGEILSVACLSVPRLGAINLHASLLPNYRGAAPIQRALMAGEIQTGVTVQWMAPEMDAGDIISQRAAHIEETDNFGSLHDRLAELGAVLLGEAVQSIRAGRATRTPQDHAAATFAPPLRTAEFLLDWTCSTRALANLVRALAPAPGARTTRNGELLKILQTNPSEFVSHQGGIPGQIVEFTNDGFIVLTGDGALEVLRVQPAGRKAMSAADYVKGYHLRRGDQLGA